jgi:hypothetical protein
MPSADPLPDADDFKKAVRLLKRALLHVVVPVAQIYFVDCDIVIYLRHDKPPHCDLIIKDFEVGVTN